MAGNGKSLSERRFVSLVNETKQAEASIEYQSQAQQRDAARKRAQDAANEVNAQESEQILSESLEQVSKPVDDTGGTTTADTANESSEAAREPANESSEANELDESVVARPRQVIDEKDMATTKKKPVRKDGRPKPVPGEGSRARARKEGKPANLAKFPRQVVEMCQDFGDANMQNTESGYMRVSNSSLTQTQAVTVMALLGLGVSISQVSSIEGLDPEVVERVKHYRSIKGEVAALDERVSTLSNRILNMNDMLMQVRALNMYSILDFQAKLKHGVSTIAQMDFYPGEVFDALNVLNSQSVVDKKRRAIYEGRTVS